MHWLKQFKGYLQSCLPKAGVQAPKEDAQQKDNVSRLLCTHPTHWCSTEPYASNIYKLLPTHP